MSAGDKQVYLQPGQKGLPVRAGGDFIFLKEAVRPVRVIVDGQPIVMTPGAKQRIKRRAAGKLAFDSFEVDNLSDTLPMQVTFVVGVGDYEQMIISGEVVSENVLRGANGDLRPNTKQVREIALFPNKLTTETYTNGELVQQENLAVSTSIDESIIFNGPNDEIWLAVEVGDANARDVYRYTRNLEAIGFYKTITQDPNGTNTRTRNAAYMPGVGVVTMTSAGSLFNAETGAFLFQVPNGGLGLGMAFVNESVIAYTGDSGGLLEFYNFVTEQVLASVDLSSSAQFQRMGFNAATNEVWVSTENHHRVEAFDATTYERTYFSDDQQWPSSLSTKGLALKGPFGVSIAEITADGNPTPVRKFALKDATVKQSFYGVEKSQQMNAYLQKTKVTNSAASFEVFDTVQGPEVKGEVIRLALESYYGQRVASDYLDHVYSVRLGRDGAGYPTLNQGGGNRSLKMIGVPDEFTVVVPAVITIEHDSELNFEGFI